MNVAEIIDMTRKLALMDNVRPYLWDDDELIFCLNRAVNELHKFTLIAKDQSTTAIMEIKLLSNLGVYALDSRILQVTQARLEDDTTQAPLTRTTEIRLNQSVSDWRNETGTPREYIPGYSSGYLSVYPKYDDTGEYVGSSDISFVSATKTISQTDGDFSDLEAGDEVVITGTEDNDGTFTVVTVGTDSFTVSETVTTEASTSATIRLVRDTLLLTVSRLGSAQFVVSDIENETEIPILNDSQAEGLPDGIAKRALLKPTTQTYDPNKAGHHKVEFELFKKEIRRDMILLHKPDKSRVPRSGTSIYY